MAKILEKALRRLFIDIKAYEHDHGFMGVLLNIFILFCGFVACFMMKSEADDTVLNDDMIRMYSMEMPPYGFYDGQGQPMGYLYELTDMLLKEAQFKGRNHLVPLGRMITDLNRGVVDCAFLGSTDFIRNNYMLVEFTGQRWSIGVVPNIHFNLDSYEALVGMKIGVPVGAKLQTQFDNDDQLSKFEVKNYQNGSWMFDRGRIDALAGVIESIQYQVGKLGGDAVKKMGEPYVLDQIGLYLTCRKKGIDHLKVRRLKDALIHMRNTGQITKVIESYTEVELKP